MIKQNIKYTVIVSSYNKGNMICDTLECLIKQNIDKSIYEIIIVNEGSTDSTEENVIDFIKNNLSHQIILITKENGGSASARNMGINNAKGDILFFIDDDCLPDYDWMLKIISGFEKYRDVDGVVGWYKNISKYYNVYCNALLCQEFFDFEDFYNFETYTNISNDLAFRNTANVAYKKEVFKKIGFFDENFKINVDFEFWERFFLHRLNALYLPIITKHKKVFNFISFIKYNFNYGESSTDFKLKHTNSQQPRKLSGILPRALQIYAKSKYHSLNPKIPLILLAEISFFLGQKFGRVNKNIESYILDEKKYLELSKINSFRKYFDITDRKNTETKYINISNIYNTSEYHKLIAETYEKNKEEKVLFSVIVPFFNRLEYLENLYKNIYRQNLDKSFFEVIIVDDGSDNEKELETLFLELSQNYPEVKSNFVYRKNGGPAAARNTGAKLAKGKYLYFTDSDVLMPANLLQQYYVFSKLYPGIGCLGGGQISNGVILKNNMYARVASRLPWNQRKNNIFISNHYKTGSVYPLDTANICYKKEDFLNISGFDEDYKTPGAEDTDLALRFSKKEFKRLWFPFFVENVRFFDILPLAKNRAKGLGVIINKNQYTIQNIWVYRIYQNTLIKVFYLLLYPLFKYKAFFEECIWNFLLMKYLEQDENFLKSDLRKRIEDEDK